MKSLALPAPAVLLAVLLSIAGLSAPAHAQWQWRDAAGRMVMSDRPPPPDVPLRNILKAPRGVKVPIAAAGEASAPNGTPNAARQNSGAPGTAAPRTAAPGTGASTTADPNSAAAAAAAPASAPAAKSIAERDMDYRKRQAEAAEAAKKAEEAAAEARATREACAAMRGNLAALSSGQRIVQTDEKGERSYLDDAQRSAETDKLNAQISQRCS